MTQLYNIALLIMELFAASEKTIFLKWITTVTSASFFFIFIVKQQQKQEKRQKSERVKKRDEIVSTEVKFKDQL